MSKRALRSKGSPPPELPLPESHRRQASQTPSSTQTPTPPVSAAPQQPSSPEPVEPSSAQSHEPSRSATPTQSTAAVEAIVAAMSQHGSHSSTPAPTTTTTFRMTISDVNKNFDNISRLTGPKDWTMWKYRVTKGLEVVKDFFQANTGAPPPNEVQSACLNAITGKMDDTILVHYLNVTDAFELMTKLNERFNPKTTVTDANELYQLFHLRRPIYELDKLLDDASDLYARITAKNMNVSDDVFYSAIMGIILPAYHHVRTTYESTVRATTPAGQTPVFKPDALVIELQKEFQNYRATHSRPNFTPAKKPESTTTGDKGKGVERTAKSNTARAATAAPYKPPTTTPLTTKKAKCFNCNQLGHTTPTCPLPWTEKSKEAMKKKGITRKSNGSASAAIVTGLGHHPTTTSTSAEPSNSQSDWVHSISSSDVEMISTPETVSPHYSFPVFTAISDQDQSHILDTGATIHCTPYLNLLFNVHTTPLLNLTVANSETIELRLAGDMRIDIPKNGSEYSTIILKNVYYNTKLPFTLISISQLEDYAFLFHHRQCTISDGSGNVLGTISENAKLYSISSLKLNEDVASLSISELHKQLGHMSYTNIKQLMKTSPSIITTAIDDFTETTCEDCVLNNIHRVSIPKKHTSPLATLFGDHFHIDIFGPLPTVSIDGYKYWLTIVDDSKRWLTLAPLKSKDEAYTQWVTFSTELFTQYGIKVKILQSDNDGVFTSHAFIQYLKSQGTIPRYTVHDTPEQNGVAENVHQHIMNSVRVNLHTAKLPNRLWWHAAQYAVYILNRTPKSAINLHTPYFE